MKKKIVVSVINDLVTDQRVNRTCNELVEIGYDVFVIGRELPNSLKMNPVPYHYFRMKLIPKRGAFFYAWFNIRLFLKLLFTKTDILWANDLDTLLANYLISKIKNKPLIFDSHEYFTEVPELENNKFAKRIWKKIEEWIVPKLTHLITVNESIANLFYEKYRKKFLVIRNVPDKKNISPTHSRKDLNIPEDKFIVILQGTGINVDRGSEELVDAFRFIPDDIHLFIVGNGDVIPLVKKYVEEHNLSSKVTFIPKQPYQLLVQYTLNANLGVTLDKDTNINYRFSLPNKIFDYIQCGIPVLSSPLVELSKIIHQYHVGWVLKEVSAKEIANQIITIAQNTSEYDMFKSNTTNAAKDLNWDNEKQVLKSVLESI